MIEDILKTCSCHYKKCDGTIYSKRRGDRNIKYRYIAPHTVMSYELYINKSYTSQYSAHEPLTGFNMI